MGKHITCLNCGTTCHGEYCHKCGQKTSTRRFQVKDVFESLITTLVGGNNRLWSTCAYLLYRPGHMTREYLLGKRVTYYSPLPLLLFLVAVYAIVIYFCTDAVSPFDIFRPEIQAGTINSSSAEAFVSHYQTFLGNNLYFSIFSVLLSLLPYRYVFRKCKILRPSGTHECLNVAEHFFALTYQVCFNLLLAFMLLPLGILEDGKAWTARICIVMPTIYCIILYKQLLSLTWGKSVWLNIKALILSLVLNFAIVLMIFGVLYGFDNAVTHAN